MSSLFDDVWDWISGGQVSRAREEEGRLYDLRHRLKIMIKNYDYWHSQGKIMSKALHQITIMAFNEVNRLHGIIEHLTINQRKIIEHNLQGKKYALKDIERSLSAVKSVF